MIFRRFPFWRGFFLLSSALNLTFPSGLLKNGRFIMLNGYRSWEICWGWFPKMSLQKNVRCGVTARRQTVPPSTSTPVAVSFCLRQMKKRKLPAGGLGEESGATTTATAYWYCSYCLLIMLQLFLLQLLLLLPLLHSVSPILCTGEFYISEPLYC